MNALCAIGLHRGPTGCPASISADADCARGCDRVVYFATKDMCGGPCWMRARVRREPKELINPGGWRGRLLCKLGIHHAPLDGPQSRSDAAGCARGCDHAVYDAGLYGGWSKRRGRTNSLPV